MKNNIIEVEEQNKVKIHGNYIQFGKDFLNFISVGRPPLVINFNIGRRKSKRFKSNDLGDYCPVPNMK